MFERFTRDARSTVTGAVAEARRAGAATVTEEHLLLSLLALDVYKRQGIDLTEIVSRVEEAHGEGALATPAPRRRTLGASLRSALGRTDPDDRGGSRHVPFTEGSKKVLEQSLRIALGRKDNHIGTLHLLLALLSRPGTPSEILTDHGITYSTAETALAA